MTVGCGKVNKSALGYGEKRSAVGHDISLDIVARFVFFDRHFLKRRHIDLNIEVACVAENGAVLHQGEVLCGDYVPAAGYGAKDIADLGRLCHGHDLVSVHDGFESANGVGFGNDDLGA